MTNLKLITLLLLAVLLINSGCGDDEETPTPSNGTTLATAAAETWTWIPKDNMFSRNGSTTGYIANLKPDATKLVIYLQGGGACFNPAVCGQNANSFGEADAQSTIANLQSPLIFNRGNADNQFADWHYIFVPYSTGDVHSGTNSDADVPNGGPADQLMVGATNFSAIVEDLQAYFNTNGAPDEILVTGSSAGGYGVYLNFVQIADAFGTDITLTGLADASPIFFDTNLFAECLNANWEVLWNFDYPDDLDNLVSGTYAYDVQKVYEYASVKYPNANFGLISTYEDDVIRQFLSFGTAGCTGLPGVLSGTAFKNGLIDMQNTLVNFPNWKVFFTEGTAHTFLGSPTLNQSVNGMDLNDWIAQLRAGNAADMME